MSSQSSHHPQENPPSCIDVQVATDDYIKYSEVLEVCQGKITDTTAGSSLAGEVEEAFGFLQIYNPVYVRALQFLEAKTTSSLPIARVPNPGDSLLKSTAEVKQGVSLARLPKLELPKFTGDLKAWAHFWGLFEAHIHNSNHSEILKFSYLISLLSGSALAAVRGLSVTADHYDTAVAILKERLGDPQVLIFRHVEELYNLSPHSSNVTADLWQLYNLLHSHVRGLQALGVQEEERRK